MLPANVDTPRGRHLHTSSYGWVEQPRNLKLWSLNVKEDDRRLVPRRDRRPALCRPVQLLQGGKVEQLGLFGPRTSLIDVQLINIILK